MSITESLVKINSTCREVVDDCERLAARGSIRLWEAAIMRQKVEAALCAARELELRTIGSAEPKRGE